MLALRESSLRETSAIDTDKNVRFTYALRTRYAQSHMLTCQMLWSFYFLSCHLVEMIYLIGDTPYTVRRTPELEPLPYYVNIVFCRTARADPK